MLTTEDLDAIRTIVHEELARTKRHRAQSARPTEPDDPWIAVLHAWLASSPYRIDPTGRAYVTQADALGALGIDPVAWGALHAPRVAAVLTVLGYRRGPRVRRRGRQGPRLTAYYLSPATVDRVDPA